MTHDELIGQSAWEPIDVTTPVKWNLFVGRRVGTTTIGFAAAWSWHSWMFGFEVLGGKAGAANGLALVLGPLWLGLAALRAHGGSHG